MTKERKAENPHDLSWLEDITIGAMNLIAAEEHLFFSSQKEGNRKYLELLDSVREMRKRTMMLFLKSPKGEEWCTVKHLLAASMRLMESGTKGMSEGRKGEAEGLFHMSFELYSMAIHIITGAKVEKIRERAKGKFGEIVKKLLDCCRE